jgi:hypothetical protein
MLDDNLSIVDKEMFVDALREIPSGPDRVRDSRLRKLAAKYYHLKGCNDEIPYSLQRFGLPDRMSFDDFIWKLVG